MLDAEQPLQGTFTVHRQRHEHGPEIVAQSTGLRLYPFRQAVADIHWHRRVKHRLIHIGIVRDKPIADCRRHATE